MATDAIDEKVEAATDAATDFNEGVITNANDLAAGDAAVDATDAQIEATDAAADALEDDEEEQAEEDGPESFLEAGVEDFLSQGFTPPPPLDCAASTATISSNGTVSDPHARCSLGREFCGCGAQRKAWTCPDSDSEVAGVQSDLNSTHAYFDHAGHGSSTRCAGDACAATDFEKFGSCCPKNPGAIVLEIGMSQPLARVLPFPLTPPSPSLLRHLLKGEGATAE